METMSAGRGPRAAELGHFSGRADLQLTLARTHEGLDDNQGKRPYEWSWFDLRLSTPVEAMLPVLPLPSAPCPQPSPEHPAET